MQAASGSILWMFQKNGFGELFFSKSFLSLALCILDLGGMGMVAPWNFYKFLPEGFLARSLWWCLVTQYVSRVHQAITSLSTTLRRMRRLLDTFLLTKQIFKRKYFCSISYIVFFWKDRRRVAEWRSNLFQAEIYNQKETGTTKSSNFWEYIKTRPSVSDKGKHVEGA